MFYKLKKTLVAAALLPLAFGCKRENVAPTNGLAAANTHKVQQWLKGNPKALTGLKAGQKSTRTAGTTLPKIDLQWAEAGFDAGTRTHWVPAAPANTKKSGTTTSTYLVATENAAGQITDGQYILVLPNAKKMGEAAAKAFKPATLLTNEKPKSFSGALLYYDVAGQLTSSRVYEAGQLQPKATANLAISSEGQGSPSANRVQVNCDMADGCIDWYWQTYVNGELVSEDYVFTTCCGGNGGPGGGGGTSGGPAITSCERTQAQAQSIIAGILLENTNDVVSTNGQAYGTANGPIRMPKTVRWGFLKLHLYLDYYLRYTLVYPGVVYRNNAQDNIWKWESVNNGELHRSGTMAPCMSVDFTHTTVPPLISADKRKFATGVTYTAVANAPCLLGVELGTFNGSHSYAAFDAGTNYAE